MAGEARATSRHRWSVNVLPFRFAYLIVAMKQIKGTVKDFPSIS